MQQSLTPPIKLFPLLKEAWGKAKGHWVKLFLICLIPGLINSGVQQLATGVRLNSWFTLVFLAIIGPIISLLACMVTTAGLLNFCRNSIIAPQDAINKSLKSIFKLLSSMFFIVLWLLPGVFFVAIGFLFLFSGEKYLDSCHQIFSLMSVIMTVLGLIWFLYVAITYCPFIVMTVLDNPKLGGWNSFCHSGELMKGHRWQLIKLWLASFVILPIITLIVLVGGLIMPIMKMGLAGLLFVLFIFLILGITFLVILLLYSIFLQLCFVTFYIKAVPLANSDGELCLNHQKHQRLYLYGLVIAIIVAGLLALFLLFPVRNSISNPANDGSSTNHRHTEGLNEQPGDDSYRG